MKFRQQLTAIILLSILFSCQKDKFNTDIDITDPNPTFIMEKTSLVVYVTDNWGVQPRAFVTIQGQTVQTDDRGRAFIKLNGTNPKGDYVVISADNRITLPKRIILQPGKKNIKHIYLERINIRSGFTTDEQAILSSSGMSIIIPPNSLVHKDGSGPYTGGYNINTKYIAPNDKIRDRKIPGGQMKMEGENFQLLTTYGMVKVEIIGTGGIPLDIAPGMQATINFSIPEELESTATETIPTFWLDESNGYWVEEGVAEKMDVSLPGMTNYNYSFKVSHFTWWSCQLYKCASDVVYIHGRLVLENGDACSGCDVEIIGSEASIIRTTSSDGSFSVLSCPNETYELIGFYRGINCDDNSGYSLGNYIVENQDTDWGEIVINDPDIISISGTVFACEADITEEGSYILVNNRHIIETSSDGHFEFLACYHQDSMVIIEGFNEAGTLMSDPVILQLDPNGHAGIELSTCLNSDVYLDVYRDGILIQHIGRPAQDRICNEDNKICIAVGKEYFEDEYFSAVMEFVSGDIDLNQVVQYTNVEVTPQSSVLYSEDVHNNINNLTGKLSTIDILEVKEYDEYKTVYLKFTALAGSPALTLNYEVEFRIKL